MTLPISVNVLLSNITFFCYLLFLTRNAAVN